MIIFHITVVLIHILQLERSDNQSLSLELVLLFAFSILHLGTLNCIRITSDFVSQPRLENIIRIRIVKVQRRMLKAAVNVEL